MFWSGINLLREGLDLPEVSLVAILDADKEGFLRSDKSLIQTMGRAARHEKGRVIMYADKITDSMKRAIDETTRRREIQEEFNRVNNITPTTITKSIDDDGISGGDDFEDKKNKKRRRGRFDLDPKKIPDEELPHAIKELTQKNEKWLLVSYGSKMRLRIETWLMSLNLDYNNSC
jgi:excinuclease ABC subunit B